MGWGTIVNCSAVLDLCQRLCYFCWVSRKLLWNNAFNCWILSARSTCDNVFRNVWNHASHSTAGEHRLAAESLLLLDTCFFRWVRFGRKWSHNVTENLSSETRHPFWFTLWKSNMATEKNSIIVILCHIQMPIKMSYVWSSKSDHDLSSSAPLSVTFLIAPGSKTSPSTDLVSSTQKSSQGQPASVVFSPVARGELCSNSFSSS